MAKPTPEPLGRRPPPLLELMIHIALVEREFPSELTGTETESQIIFEPLPLLRRQPFDLLRKERVPRGLFVDGTHDALEGSGIPDSNWRPSAWEAGLERGLTQFFHHSCAD